MSQTATVLDPSTATSSDKEYPVIMLVEPEVHADAYQHGQSADGMLALLKRISEASRSANPRLAITAVLKSQTVDPALAQAEIFVDGQHFITDTIAVAAGTARINATGGGMLLAVGKARVRAFERFQLWVTDDVSADTYGAVHTNASGRARINSFDRSTGVARDQVQGTLRAQSAWTVDGDACFFDSLDRSEIRAGSGTIRAYGRSRIYGDGAVDVTLYESANGWLRGLVRGTLAGNSLAYVEPTVRVTVGGNARLMPFGV